jgi:hypothetical protein
MIVEMRAYKIAPGARAKFIAVMREKLLPEHKRLGIPYAGPFPTADNENGLFWMRGFADLAAREKLTGAIYGGEVWKRDCADALLPVLEKYDVTVVDVPDGTIEWA